MNNRYLTMDETSAKYFNKMTKGITHLFIKNLVSELKELKPDTILDVGCGTGYITNIISNELNSTVIGCDIDSNRISFARMNFDQQVFIANVTQLPFKDSSFDVVVASEILEHIPFREHALIEIKRVAKKSVVITVPNEPYFMIANFLRGKNIRSYGNPSEHINHYSKKSLKRLLDDYFLKVKVNTNAIFWIIAITEKSEIL